MITCLLLPSSRDDVRRGVIEAANAALQEYMSREHPVLAEKCVISDLMKEVWKEKVSSEPALANEPFGVRRVFAR